MGAPPESIVDLQFLVDLERPTAARSRPNAVARVNDLRQRVGCSEGTVFVMSGQIDLIKKAQDVGIRAFARVMKAASEPVGLLIAGIGPGEEELKQLAQNLGVTDSVAFLGWQEADEMDSVYMAADALLHPANYDPFPLVVMEAMSFGRAVVGSRTSGSVEERVQDGVNGYSFPAGDEEAIAEAMKKLVDDPERKEALQRAARVTAETWPISRGVNVVRETMNRLLAAESGET
jgi:1,4-alpha-glucan branching enzyme